MQITEVASIWLNVLEIFSLVAVSLLTLAWDENQSAPDFNRDIKPILSERCFVCHGPDESSREAGLRLDVREAAVEFAISPGDAENSDFYLRVTEADEDLRMPPAEHGAALSQNEIELLKQWIDSGAKYEKHWSYKPPTKLAESGNRNPWSRNRIDDFVAERLSNSGLNHSEPADRVSIIRRLALDLTGLPPTLEEADELFRDGSEEDYESMVDHFLAKPAFGERWAVVWLDHARYADSKGYAEDRAREIWAYRDYVIRSFNANKPFDQFTIEQLAGDLLENPSREQLVATAFHRNTSTNTEGGTIDEEFRSVAVVDRTNTTMAVWMGTTMGCAQCHTHKYDPITQEEYFQFYAFFNSTADNDLPTDAPLLEIFSGEQEREIKELKEKISDIESQIAAWDASSETDKKKFLSPQQSQWEAIARTRRSNKVSGRFVRFQLPKPKSILSLAEVEVFVGEQNVARLGTAKQVSTAYDGAAALAIDGNTDGDFHAGASVTHTATQRDPWWELELDRDYDIYRIVVWNRTENLHRRLDGVQISILDSERDEVWRQQIETASAKPQEFTVSYLPQEIFDIAIKDSHTPEQQEKLDQFYRQQHGPNIARSEQVNSLKTKIRSIKPQTTVPILKELDKHRETHVHIRGSYLDHGKKVQRGTPSAFHPLQAREPDRLALANWIVSEENPLTARVIANRFWQQLFGIGIVATSEEFGAQGELPTHPELLDYLACQFMESGWDVKALLKLMVTSATYRQSSSASEDQMKQDPNNRLLSRGPRFRLTAEMIRDQALACSGLLSPKMYGAPTQPPQPKSGLKFSFGGGTADWKDSVGEDRYRRAIYTRWRRTSPYPSMTTFDVANREVCELRRLRTNTPLQALVTLNDPVYVEAAQSLARQVYSKEQTAEQTAEVAFRRCLIRRPTESELTLLVALYQEAKTHFESQPEVARTFANDELNPLPEDTNWVEHAAWTTVANTILNLDEMFLKR